MDEQIDSLNRIGDIKTEKSADLQITVRTYCNAIAKVFKDAGLSFQKVRTTLVAEVALQIIFLEPVYAAPNNNSSDEKWARERARLISALMAHLNELSPPQMIEARKSYEQILFETGIQIGTVCYGLSTFVLFPFGGWLHDRQETNRDFIGGSGVGFFRDHMACSASTPLGLD